MFYDELENALSDAKVSYDERTKIIKQLKDNGVEFEMEPNKFINVHFRVKAHEFD